MRPVRHVPLVTRGLAAALLFAASAASAQVPARQVPASAGAPASAVPPRAPVFSQPVLRAGAVRAAGLGVADGRAIAPPAWTARLDATARLLALGVAPELLLGGDAVLFRGPDGRPTVDLFVRTSAPAALGRVAGVEVRAVAGDVAVVRAPISAIETLARSADVQYVEASQTRQGYNDSGRADMRADEVHAGGGGLPRAFMGQGVTVGVVDSGLDVAHPDFFSGGTSRVRFLLEMLEAGGQTEYTRAQITANPAGIPQRDRNGHGTHVTGSAAGSGGIRPELRGVAPAADIVAVKGSRQNNGRSSFSDTDVVAGVSYIFQKAQDAGQPAVANLSLGGPFGPHDGTSLYEQALTNLSGAGRIIVAAVGNDGDRPVHAGDASQANTLNETLWFAGSPDFAAATLWYDGGALGEFGIAAYLVTGGQLEQIGLVSVSAGQVLGGGQNGVPYVADNGQTIANVTIDAATTSAPGNNDGNVIFQLQGGPGIDLRNVVWSIASIGPGVGRFDVWSLVGSEFYAQTVGFPWNEVPGDARYTVSPPSTALAVIGVGSHITNNDWVDIDGTPRQQLEPNPDGNPNSPPVVVPLGRLSSFSSRGPTRDGRVGLDVTGPGEIIFSTHSADAVVGNGGIARRENLLQGGGYLGSQGTSMSSPHVAGLVALMLQADPSLTPAEVRQILRETGRADGATGGLPNANFGHGKADALAAVLRTLQLCGAACGGTGTGTTATEAEPNNAPDQAQSLGGGSPITLTGAAQQTDTGTITVDYGGGDIDDLEDMFRITTTGPGLSLSLGGFNRDLDLFLIDGAATQFIAVSNAVGENGTETISQPTLPAGTYLVGVSYYDGGGAGQTPYALVATGAFSVAGEDAPLAGGLVLRALAPNPVRGTGEVAFDLPAALDVRVAVYDVLGREVARLADGPYAAGAHAVAFDASRLSAGLYVVRLAAGAEARTQRLIVAR